MTDELDNLVAMIRRLKLEENQLKLENSIAQLKSERFIDEECIGCAGPCMAVGVTADLKKDLVECCECNKVLEDDNSSLRETINQMAKKWSVDRAIIKNFKAIETKETDRLHKLIDDYKDGINQKYNEDMRKKNATIEELKDRNIEDLHELYDLDKEEIDQLKHVISARDLTIKSLTTMCQSSGGILDKLANHKNTIQRLEAQLVASRTRCDYLSDQIADKDATIDGLNAELSVRKGDSEVLMKVVEIVKDVTPTCCNTLNMVCVLLNDYLDALEGPPETSIDENQDITVTVALLELP